jgi:hypothetical protein
MGLKLFSVTSRARVKVTLRVLFAVDATRRFSLNICPYFWSFLLVSRCAMFKGGKNTPGDHNIPQVTNHGLLKYPFRLNL